MAKKRKSRKRVEITRNSGEIKIEKMLVDNFVSLQKVMLNLSLKVDNLVSQISRLLELFEISAKALADKDFSIERKTEDDKKISEKIDTILDQNKVIARGLTLLHEPSGMQEQVYQPAQNFPPQQTSMIYPQTIPQQQMPLRQPSSEVTQSLDSETYQKSIYSGSDSSMPRKPTKPLYSKRVHEEP